ncbi:MAG: hypothetical protein WC795_00365 [Candidatus Paceibacterota bacterium]|jgi:DNA polymerase III delta prime subunit
MRELSSYFNSTLHHAYIIEGEGEVLVPDILSALSEKGIAIEGNPDVLVEKYETFTVDDSRRLKSFASERGVAGTERFFIFSIAFFTREATQTLLKIFEEPNEGIHFILVIPRISALPETLRSRAEIIQLGKSNTNTEILKSAQKFLFADIPSRLAIIKKIIDSHKDDEDAGAIRHEALSLLNHIEGLLAEKVSEDTPLHDEVKELYACKKFLSSQGASVKILLEHMALILPKI